MECGRSWSISQGMKDALWALFLGWLLWLTSGAIILAWALWVE